MRVAAGAVARKVLGRASPSAAPWSRSARIASTAPRGTGREIENNPFFCPDPPWSRVGGLPRRVRKSGSSTGAVDRGRGRRRARRLGAPIYGKLDADIAAALMWINAVKGVEIGAGFAAAALSGEENADEMPHGAGRPDFRLQPRWRHPGRHFHQQLAALLDRNSGRPS